MTNKKRIEEHNRWFEVVIIPRKHYQMFKVDFGTTPPKKTAVTKIFKGADYDKDFPKDRESCYEVQRIRYKPGTHTL